MSHLNAQSLDSSVISDNPYQAPLTPFEPSVVRTDDKKIRWIRTVVCLKMLTIVVGVAAAFWKIQTITVSGSILTILGGFVTIMLWRRPSNSRSAVAMIFGLSGPVISLVCFLLILLNNWSPPDARQPVSMIALSYGLLSLPLGFVAAFHGLRNAPASATPNAQENSPDDIR